MQERINRHDRCHGAGRTSAEATPQRQSLSDGQGDAASLAKRAQKRLGRNTSGVVRRLAWQPSAVAEDVVNPDIDARSAEASRGWQDPRVDLVAGRFERKAEDVEPAGDVRHGGRGERGDDAISHVDIVAGWWESSIRET